MTVDDHLAAFAAGALDAPGLSLPEFIPVDWAAFDGEVEARWLAETAALIPYGHEAELAGRLSAAVADVAPRLDAGTFATFIASGFEITPATAYAPDGRDLIYTKINHGFWEHLYWIHAAGHDPERMRAYKPGPMGMRYMRPGFCAALAALVRAFAQADNETMRFRDVLFGVSLNNGSVPYSRIPRRFIEGPALSRQVLLGSTIGVTSFFHALFGPRRLAFQDGSFPKDGLNTGALRRTLSDFAAVSRRVIFVVPPHLKGIRLDGVATPQEVIFVSVTTVHEAWLATLRACARHVLERLATDDAVTVITQSGVFSAVLGLYLKLAKDALYPDRRLYFFDLGQALDIANPAQAGPYLARNVVEDKTLFYSV